MGLNWQQQQMIGSYFEHFLAIIRCIYGDKDVSRLCSINKYIWHTLPLKKRLKDVKSELRATKHRRGGGNRERWALDIPLTEEISRKNTEDTNCAQAFEGRATGLSFFLHGVSHFEDLGLTANTLKYTIISIFHADYKWILKFKARVKEGSKHAGLL